MDDDLDIYGDLGDFDKDEQIRNDNAQIAELTEKLKRSEECRTSAEEHIKKLTQETTVLKKNLSSLLVTAQAETGRKDKEIQKLRREKEDICFRRAQVQNKFREPVVIKPAAPQTEISVQTDYTFTPDDTIYVQRTAQHTISISVQGQEKRAVASGRNPFQRRQSVSAEQHHRKENESKYEGRDKSYKRRGGPSDERSAKRHRSKSVERRHHPHVDHKQSNNDVHDNRKPNDKREHREKPSSSDRSTRSSSFHSKKHNTNPTSEIVPQPKLSHSDELEDLLETKKQIESTLASGVLKNPSTEVKDKSESTIKLDNSIKVEESVTPLHIRKKCTWEIIPNEVVQTMPNQPRSTSPALASPNLHNTNKADCLLPATNANKEKVPNTESKSYEDTSIFNQDASKKTTSSNKPNEPIIEANRIAKQRETIAAPIAKVKQSEPKPKETSNRSSSSKSRERESDSKHSSKSNQQSRDVDECNLKPKGIFELDRKQVKNKIESSHVRQVQQKSNAKPTSRTETKTPLSLLMDELKDSPPEQDSVTNSAKINARRKTYCGEPKTSKQSEPKSKETSKRSSSSKSRERESESKHSSKSNQQPRDVDACNMKPKGILDLNRKQEKNKTESSHVGQVQQKTPLSLLMDELKDSPPEQDTVTNSAKINARRKTYCGEPKTSKRDSSGERHTRRELSKDSDTKRESSKENHKTRETSKERRHKKSSNRESSKESHSNRDSSKETYPEPSVDSSSKRNSPINTHTKQESSKENISKSVCSKNSHTKREPSKDSHAKKESSRDAKLYQMFGTDSEQSFSIAIPTPVPPHNDVTPKRTSNPIDICDTPISSIVELIFANDDSTTTTSTNTATINDSHDSIHMEEETVENIDLYLSRRKRKRMSDGKKNLFPAVEAKPENTVAVDDPTNKSVDVHQVVSMDVDVELSQKCVHDVNKDGKKNLFPAVEAKPENTVAVDDPTNKSVDVHQVVSMDVDVELSQKCVHDVNKECASIISLFDALETPRKSVVTFKARSDPGSLVNTVGLKVDSAEGTTLSKFEVEDVAMDKSLDQISSGKHSPNLNVEPESISVEGPSAVDLPTDKQQQEEIKLDPSQSINSNALKILEKPAFPTSTLDSIAGQSLIKSPPIAVDRSSTETQSELQPLPRISSTHECTSDKPLEDYSSEPKKDLNTLPTICIGTEPSVAIEVNHSSSETDIKITNLNDTIPIETSVTAGSDPAPTAGPESSIIIPMDGEPIEQSPTTKRVLQSTSRLSYYIEANENEVTMFVASRKKKKKPKQK